MAKRRDNGGGAGGLILVFFSFLCALLLTMAVYGPAIIIFAGLLYYEIRTLTLPKTFSLDDHEFSVLMKKERKLRKLAKRLWEIDQEGSHLKRNMDGSFHRGSKLGMQLNDEIDDITPEYISIESDSAELRNKPLALFDNWLKTSSYRFAFRVSAVFYIGFFIFIYFSRPVIIMSFFESISKHLLLLASGENDLFYAAALISGLVAIPVFAVSFFSQKSKLETTTDPNKAYWAQFAEGSHNLNGTTSAGHTSVAQGAAGVSA